MVSTNTLASTVFGSQLAKVEDSLNASVTSLEAAMSLNIPSSCIVNEEPHSV